MARRYSFYDHIVCSHLAPLPKHMRGLHRTRDGRWMMAFAVSQFSTKALMVDIDTADVWVRPRASGLRVAVGMAHARSASASSFLGTKARLVYMVNLASANV